MSKLSEIKIECIRQAKRSGDIHYVLGKLQNKKPVNIPFHCDSVFDTDVLEIIFIGFPHSSISHTVVTEENKARFDAEESNYSKFKKRQVRKKGLTWERYNMENAI